MRWSRLLLLAVLLIVPACGIFGSSNAPLPATMPPNFFIGMRVLEQQDPPIDYQIKVERSGEVEYETTIRAPRRRVFEGTLELTESQVLRLYEAAQQVSFSSLPQEVSAEPGASNRAENGERIVYVIAGEVDRAFKVMYAQDESMDVLQKAILAEMPPRVLTGEGGPGGMLDRPEAFVGDSATKTFHHPECELCEKITADDRESYTNEYDALNFGFHPCDVCRPLDTRN
jgi:hypothetical protein